MLYKHLSNASLILNWHDDVFIFRMTAIIFSLHTADKRKWEVYFLSLQICKTDSINAEFLRSKWFLKAILRILINYLISKVGNFRFKGFTFCSCIQLNQGVFSYNKCELLRKSSLKQNDLEGVISTVSATLAYTIVIRQKRIGINFMDLKNIDKEW